MKRSLPFILGLSTSLLSINTVYAAGLEQAFQSNDPHKLFKELDAGNKGYLTFEDLKAGFKERNLPVNDAMIKEMIRMASKDGNDLTTFAEFTDVAESEEERLARIYPDLHRQFKEMDIGNKGYLNFADFKAKNQSADDAAIMDIIRTASTDGDDQVSFEEYCAIAKRPSQI
ncbi:EF-hand domain-containing protein [Pleionea sp. CnH1-48]|uniref:EF-hand domain-containing protein n=1 Tax=Pleionea sp. CnH1-48 TaxID=2954494 RepID=UPI002096D668|nr:EF-hand domain-containing protein [Pleionea sp. CnH1-48]MCO7223897.1 EF-hand domain-containing protein [Pleionea sp. CnH1-48]